MEEIREKVRNLLDELPEEQLQAFAEAMQSFKLLNDQIDGNPANLDSAEAFISVFKLQDICASLVRKKRQQEIASEDVNQDLEDSQPVLTDPIHKAFGIFSKYANPSLIPLEKEAWPRAAMEKHATSRR